MSPRPAELFEVGPAEGPAVIRPARGDRMPRFLGVGKIDPATALARLSVALIGVGGVGRHVAIHLARLMVARLWIVDQGRFKPQSLLTQAIAPEDVGQSKAGNAGRLVKAISPDTRVRVFNGPVETLEPTALAEADLVFLATDNLRAEVEVGQRCTNLGQPLVQASVSGDTLVAQVRFFANGSGQDPCPACLFGSDEWTMLEQETPQSCEGGPEAPIDGPPTVSVSFLCSLAADLAMTQILRFVLGLGSPVGNTLLEHCGYTHRVVTSPLARNAACPVEHVRWAPAKTDAPLAERTLRELAGGAGLGERSSFMVDETSYVHRGLCAAGHERPVERFLDPDGVAGRCPSCGDSLVAQPVHTHRRAPTALLSSVMDRPLGDLCPSPPRRVVVREGERAVLFRESTTGVNGP